MIPDLGSETAEASSGAPFDRLLVPLDFSPSSRTALVTAMRIAERHRSEVVLFHADGFDVNEEFLSCLGAPWSRSDILEEVEHHLRDFADMVYPGSASRVGVEAVAHADDPAKAVAGAAQRHGTTLVVLGGGERTRWRRSNAERIAHALPCAVLFARDS
jgi:nucleotide-binding universal stress UspA family protein